jgi:hypothetical protein
VQDERHRNVRSQSTLDTLLCEQTRVMAAGGAADRTAAEVPYCQLGDTPLVVLGVDAEPTRVLHGMRGALQTRYVGGVVWEISPRRAEQLQSQLALLKDSGYAVFAVYKDERSRSEVSGWLGGRVVASMRWTARIRSSVV